MSYLIEDGNVSKYNNYKIQNILCTIMYRYDINYITTVEHGSDYV